MKALFVTAIGDPNAKTTGKVELRDIPKPEPGDEDVLIKVAYASICGSDGHVLRGNLGPLRPMILGMLPMRMGHEVSGVIEKAGKTAVSAGFKEGDRVTCNYTHFCGSCYFCRTGRENFCLHPKPLADAMSEYICWHMSQVFKIPDHVTLLYASLTEPLSIAVNAVRTAQVKFGSRVAVFGSGSIGLMALQAAKMNGASLVAAFDVVPEKLALAKKTGADAVLNTSESGYEQRALELTDGLGFDSIIESTGVPAVAQSTLGLLSPDGHAVYFAMYQTDFELKVNLFNELYLKQKHLHGMYTSADLFPQVVSLLHRMDLGSLIQGTYKLEECEKAMQDQLSGKYIKLVFEIGGE
jgi:(R,R)-butanediol dehydrogenase/meso-butanediol dehydrogenase/diacetyl reductase/L-iditol 2-dehydrogenase